MSLLTSPWRSKAPAMSEGTLLSGMMKRSFTETYNSEEKREGEREIVIEGERERDREGEREREIDRDRERQRER